MNKKSLWKLILIIAIHVLLALCQLGRIKRTGVVLLVFTAAIVGLVIKPFPEPVVLLIAVAASMVVVE